MKVIWLGQNGLLFISGRTKVLVDPYLSDSLRHYDNTKVRRWAINKKFHTVEPSVMILTSSRPDHTDTETLRYYINGNKQLVTVLCCEGAFKKISSAGFVGKYNKVFMDNSSHWTHDNLYFQAVPAYTNESGALGMIITDASNGKKYYVTSNTVYTDDIFKYIPKDIDTLFIPISGETGGMDAEKASYFARAVNAKHTVPLKFGMFDNIDPLSLDVDNVIVPVIYKIIPLEEEDAFVGSPVSFSNASEKKAENKEEKANTYAPVAEDEDTEEAAPDLNVAKTEQKEKAEDMENIKDTEYIKHNKENGDTPSKDHFDPFATDKLDGTVEIDAARYAVAFATLESIEEMSKDENLASAVPVTEAEDTDEEITVEPDTGRKFDNTMEIEIDKIKTASNTSFDDPDFDFRQFVYNPNKNNEDVKEEIAFESAEKITEETVEEIVEEVAEEIAEETIEEPVEEIVEEPAEEIIEEIAEEVDEEEIEEIDTEDDEFDDALFDAEEDCDYDEEFYRKDSEYDLKYAIVHGEFYDEDENEADELDVIDGNVGDSNDEELYTEEKDISFEQVSLFEEVIEEAAEDVVEEAVEEATEEITEETVEELAEEAVEEVVKEPVDEVAEEPAEEIVEEPIEEIIEEATEEVAEEIIEEVAEEIIEEYPDAEVIYDEDGNEICTYDGVVMHYESDADDEELFGFDVGDDYYDDEPKKDDEDVSHIIDAYVNVLEKLDNGEDVDFSSIVF